MIQAKNLCLSFGSQTVFDNLNFTCAEDQRIGLVGLNGSGKSTLLAAINDPSILDEGSVSILRGKTFAYMPQNIVLVSTKSIIDEALSAFSVMGSLTKKIAELETQIAQHSTEELLAAYAQAQEELAMLNPEHARAQTKKVLAGLGFLPSQFNTPVADLSVGWKMRIVLVKLLLQDADFYLFDEPTNHLDLIAKEWFLKFLKESSFGFMIVCHERYFLDELCDTILDLDRGVGTIYNSNYSNYVIQKQQALERLQASYIQQQKELKRKKETIERFKAKASKAKMAQSMMKALDKIEIISLPPGPKSISFSFSTIAQAGRTVLTVDKVSQKFGDKLVFKDVSFDIERGQKVAIIAPNGVGKTTLFNVISGALPLQTGTVTFGYNVTHAVFDQDQTKSLDMSAMVIDAVKKKCPRSTEQAIRSFLGAFLFSGDDVKKKVSVLSGGEKNRVGMVTVLLQQANLMMLDEPTNHLDILSKEILLRALKEYTGTILFVSHDREFINDLATHVIELTQTGAHAYEGNYDSYAYQKKTNKAVGAADNNGSDSAADAKSGAAGVDKGQRFEMQKKAKRLEESIIKMEKQLQDIAMSFADFEYGSDEYVEAEAQMEKVKQSVTQAQEQWLALTTQLEKMGE